MICDVREGLTGILTISYDGRSETYIPNYDQDQARELLLEFQALHDDDGCGLTKNYLAEDYNWYPSMISYLYWYLFFPYVKYAPLVAEWMAGRRDFRWQGQGQFRTLMELLGETGYRPTWRTRLRYLALRLNNHLVARHSTADLLFFRFAQSDFRTAEIRKTLDEIGISYLNVAPAPRTLEIPSRYLKGERTYYFSQPPPMNRGNCFRRRYSLDHLDSDKGRLFAVGIQVVERFVTSFVVEYRHHLQALRNCKPKTFYGLDDINGFLFPVLYACRRLGLRTIGHQHGAYVRRHAGYMMEGIAPAEWQWFDHVIVWGEFWKDKMLRISKAYPPGFFVVGSNKFSTVLPAVETPANSPRTVLIPYEFLANTARIGEYIRKLMDLGYKVAFKTRPDEDLAGQIEAYCLPHSYRERLTIVTKLDATALSQIDIVAGTMTTLIYELLPCGKIIWILDTEFRHLDDLVEEGFARKVRFEDLENLDDSYFHPTHVDRVSLFGKATLEETLRCQVLSMNQPPGATAPTVEDA